MAGAAALEVVRKFEAGNDIRQIVSCSEGGRALRLLKRREDMQKKAEAAKDLIENETKKRKFGTIDSKFGGSQADVLEEEFKKQTVGLMSVEEFTAKRKAIDELITAAQSSGSRKELRLKRKINTKKLSFDDPDMDSGDESDNSNSEVEMEAKPRKNFGKDPTVNTSFLYDADREADLVRKREQLIREYKASQETAKKEKLEVTYSYWDGSGHRRSVMVEKGWTIAQFLAKSKKDLETTDFPELRTCTLDSLMYVKEDLIIPHNITFFDLIKEKARGKSGPLFNFGVEENIQKRGDVRVESADSHAGKIVDKKWYERNKHIFPACRWEMYSKDKTYGEKSAAEVDPLKPQV
eukprot:TRINITY_DN1786_c0_g1_i2.p1 TRINITY_DN1786_c0_g1~~TRINITY_DN1786_c0_g1_i2.p1  ORF type:complete len:372 (+),score=117.53 TRINITY_DN1786_c0_g1_i2:66-1118(+)